MIIFHSLAPSGQRKKDLDKRKPAAPTSGGARILMGVCVVLILSVLLSIHLLPERVSLQVGDTSPGEIRAHRTVRYIDTVGTERLREEAAARADRVYSIVPRAASEASENLSSILNALRRARLDPDLHSTPARIGYVRRSLRPDLNAALRDETLTALLTADGRTFDRIESYAGTLVRRIAAREICDDTDEVKAARSEFRRRLTDYLGNTTYATAAADVGSSLIRPNRLFDPQATEKARERERRLAPTRYAQVFRGEVIVSKSERITPEHLDKFMALGLRHPRADYVSMTCIAVLVAFIVVFAIAYLARYHAHIYHETKLLGLLSLIVVISVLGLKLGGTALGLNLSGAQSGYFAMTWIATAGMLAAILVNPQIAVMTVALLATTTQLAMGQELRWSVAALVSSLVAVYSVSDIRHRSDLMRAAMMVSLTNLGMVWLIGQISGDTLNDLLVGSGWAVAGGISSVGLSWLGTAALEKPFGITTHNRLLELADTNNPILKRLLMEAPGTYSHSVFVGNIAAGAAEDIGADPLLVRVAAYYHDVGKMKRPHFFVENQHVENVHDRLNPSLSALVIRSHIKDGLELAKEYRLPPLLRELMGQHHGTSIVRYFYQQAAGEGTNGSAMLEQQFRYEGTKPQSKEAALLMLADSVEAASRSLAKPSLGRIEDMVDKIIGDRHSDGQLDESDLTFKDISRIRDSFVRTLTSMMHARIEYPEPAGAEAKKAAANGSADKEPSEGAGEPGKTEKGRTEIAAG